MRAFYWRWLRTAFWRSLGPIDLWTGLVGSLLGLADHYLPEASLMTTYGWQIPIWALASVMLVRLLLAPYWMWQDDQANAPTKKERSAIELLAGKMHEGSRLLNRRVQTEAELAVWAKDCDAWTNEIYSEIEAHFGKAQAVTFRAVVSVQAADMIPHFNEWHNSKKPRLNKRIENLRTFINANGYGTR